MHNFSITQQLTLKEYRQLVFTMLYSHVGFICITVLAVISLVVLPFVYRSEHDEIMGDSFFTWEQRSFLSLFTIRWPAGLKQAGCFVEIIGSMKI